jgi:hypothetical protein
MTAWPPSKTFDRDATLISTRAKTAPYNAAVLSTNFSQNYKSTKTLTSEIETHQLST